MFVRHGPVSARETPAYGVHAYKIHAYEMDVHETHAIRFAGSFGGLKCHVTLILFGPITAIWLSENVRIGRHTGPEVAPTPKLQAKLRP